MLPSPNSWVFVQYWVMFFTKNLTSDLFFFTCLCCEYSILSPMSPIFRINYDPLVYNNRYNGFPSFLNNFWFWWMHSKLKKWSLCPGFCSATMSNVTNRTIRHDLVQGVLTLTHMNNENRNTTYIYLLSLLILSLCFVLLFINTFTSKLSSTNERGMTSANIDRRWADRFYFYLWKRINKYICV